VSVGIALFATECANLSTGVLRASGRVAAG
jgi:hypothetical protein